MRSDLNPSLYQSLIPLILLFIIVFSLGGLYPAVGINPYDELRRLTISTTAVFLALGTMSFWIRNVEMYSRASFALTWAIAIIAIPAARHIVRAWLPGAVFGVNQLSLLVMAKKVLASSTC